MVVVRLVNVTKVFRTGVVGVKDINLTVNHKEFMALLGPSGSGKSTTLYLIAGIYRPSSGKIFFDDRDVTNVPPKDRNIGLVFQNWALYPHMRVYDNIAFPLRIKRLPENEIRKKVLETARMLRIEKLLNRYPWQLSGGQQQRVAIARALVKEPDVLLLDEPLSNLDAQLRISVRAELKRLQKKLGITTIYVTHDQAEALAMADRIAVINNGRIIQIGAPEQVYTKPATVFVGGFLGNPPMNFVEGEIIEDKGKLYIVIAGQKIISPTHYEPIVRRRGLRKVIVGFRPEDTMILPECRDRNECVKGMVYAVEPMGREYIVVADLGGELVKAIVPRTLVLTDDQEICLCPSLAKIVLFDPKTEKSLESLAAEKD